MVVCILIVLLFGSPHCSLQEHPLILPCLALRNTYSEAATTSLESTARHHLRTRIHPLRILLRHHENIRTIHTTRGSSKLSCPLTTLALTFFDCSF